MRKTKPLRKTTDVDRHIQSRIINLRKERGLKKEDIDDFAGFRRGTTRKIEQGDIGMHASQLYVIAAALGVRPEDFYDGLPQGKDNPDGGNNNLPGEAEVHDFALTYMSIKEPKLRRKIAELINSVGKARAKRG